MENQLPLIVKFKMKAEHLEYVKSELFKILEPTRKEDGCVLYELHQDLDDPNILMFYEIWETKAAWQAHDLTSHIITFKQNIEGFVEHISVNKLKVI